MLVLCDKSDLCFPLFECFIYLVIQPLKYFMPHVELKILEFAEAPLVSMSINYHVRLLFQE